MPKYEFHILSWEEMNEYFESLTINNDIDPEANSGFGMGRATAKKNAEQEMAELPEEERSISTFLTMWEGMFSKYPQLQKVDTYSTKDNVASESIYNQIPSFAKTVGNRILEGDMTYAKHAGLDVIYGLIRGIKEEKWAEMPEFAHYAKLLLNRCYLPLPIPRTEVPTRGDAKEAYRNSIKTDEASKENLNAMLGMLAVQAPFEKNVDVLIPYSGLHPDYESVNDDMWVMYERDAHPIMTAAKIYELSRCQPLMEYLKTPEAIKKAKEGTLDYAELEYLMVDQKEVERANEYEEKLDREKAAAEQQRQAKEKAERGRQVQAKRQKDLREMLERLGVTEEDLTKNPKDLKLKGSTEYNNMARAALEAYQSAISDQVYDIDNDEKVRQACFAYTKGKKSVRTFESGRKRFAACLDLMMSVSEPNADGVFPDGIEEQFERINTVRKANPGSPNYVSPRHFKFAENQATVRDAINHYIETHQEDFEEITIPGTNMKEYSPEKATYIVNRLKDSMPKLPNGEVDYDAYVDKDTLKDCYGPNRGVDRIGNAFYDYKWKYKYDKETKEKSEEYRRNQQAAEERKVREKAEKEEQERLKQEQEKEQERLKQEQEEQEREKQKLKEQMQSEFVEQYAEIMQFSINAHEQQAKQETEALDRENAKKIGQKADSFNEMLNSILANKQKAVDDKAAAEERTQEKIIKRGNEFSQYQNELADAWQKYYSETRFEQQTRLQGRSKDYSKTAVAVYEDCLHTAYTTSSADKAMLNASRAFAITRLFKPNEPVNYEQINNMAAKIQKDSSWSRNLANCIVFDKNKGMPVFDQNDKRFDAVEDKFRQEIRNPYVFAEDREIKGPKQKLTVADVRDTLLKATVNSMELWKGDKQIFDSNEAQRKTECTVQNQLYFNYMKKFHTMTTEEQQKELGKKDAPMPTFFKQGEMGEDMHEDRSMIIRATVAGRLLEKMYPDQNATPDLEKLQQETEKVVNNGELMAECVNREMDQSLLQEIWQKCDTHLENERAAEELAREEERKAEQEKINQQKQKEENKRAALNRLKV